MRLSTSRHGNQAYPTARSRFGPNTTHSGDGTMGSKSVDLELDLSRGQLSGQVNGQAVQAEMVNLDMTDLAPHLYLLAPTR